MFRRELDALRRNKAGEGVMLLLGRQVFMNGRHDGFISPPNTDSDSSDEQWNSECQVHNAVQCTFFHTPILLQKLEGDDGGRILLAKINGLALNKVSRKCAQMNPRANACR